MLRRKFQVVLILGGALWASEPKLVTAVHSVGLTVSDLDHSVEFYSKVLSFEKVSEFEVDGRGDWIAHLGGKVERDGAGNIVTVNLRGNWINDIEMIELARLPYLRTLDLSHTRISDEGMLRLKAAPRISVLNLFYSEWITDQGLTAIRNWKHLKRLNVRGTRISDGTLAIVSRLAGLEALDIANTQVTGNGLDHLITLTNLKELALGGSRLGETHKVLRMLPTLTYLDLSGARANP